MDPNPVPDVSLAKIEKTNSLTILEQESLGEWAAQNRPPIPLALALKMYELFLNGYNCDEICRVNGSKFPLGMIVDARVRYGWDERKAKQLESLYGNIEDKVLRIKNQAVSHVADLLAAAHRIQHDKILKAIQEGDSDALTELEAQIGSIKGYKEVVNLLLLLTDGAKESKSAAQGKVHIDGEVKHVHSVSEDKLTGGSANKLLEWLDKTVDSE